MHLVAVVVCLSFARVAGVLALHAVLSTFMRAQALRLSVSGTVWANLTVCHVLHDTSDVISKT